MNKINQFTFNQNPEDAFNMASDVCFEVHRDFLQGFLLFSIEDKYMISFINEKFTIKFYCDVSKTCALYRSITFLRNNNDIKYPNDCTKFAVVDYDDISYGRMAKMDFGKFLCELGFECHFFPSYWETDIESQRL